MNQRKRHVNWKKQKQREPPQKLPKRSHATLLQETYLELGTSRLPTVNDLIKKHNLALAEKRLEELSQQCVITLRPKYELPQLANFATPSLTKSLSVEDMDSNLTPELGTPPLDDEGKECWFIPSLMDTKTGDVDELFFDPADCGHLYVNNDIFTF